jgi:hypothetical protein
MLQVQKVLEHGPGPNSQTLFLFSSLVDDVVVVCFVFANLCMSQVYPIINYEQLLSSCLHAFTV